LNAIHSAAKEERRTLEIPVYWRHRKEPEVKHELKARRVIATRRTIVFHHTSENFRFPIGYSTLDA
jgi:hypothetical protein